MNIVIPKIYQLQMKKTIKLESLWNKPIRYHGVKAQYLLWETLNGIQERLMGPRLKVRAFPGGIIHDFYHNALPLLEKKLTYVIIMAGTNDSLTKTSEAILVELLTKNVHRR